MHHSFTNCEAGAQCGHCLNRQHTHTDAPPPAKPLIPPVPQHIQITTCGLTAQAVQDEVQTVCVPQQKLAHWPPALCQFTHITAINLSGNAITYLPQAVQNLQGLQQLVVSRNALGSLPPEISALTALTELDVGSNNIKKLPDTLCALTGLKVCCDP